MDMPVENAATVWQKTLAELLVQSGALDQASLQRAEKLASGQGLRLDRTLLKLGLIDETTLLPSLCASLGVDS